MSSVVRLILYVTVLAAVLQQVIEWFREFRRQVVVPLLVCRGITSKYFFVWDPWGHL